MSEKSIVSPEEAQRYLDQPAVGHILDDYLMEYALTIATEPERIKTARVESYNQGYVEGFEKSANGESDRIRAAVVKVLRRFNDEYDGDALMLADAIENGSDF